jgi:hypothetical protein
VQLDPLVKRRVQSLKESPVLLSVKERGGRHGSA